MKAKKEKVEANDLLDNALRSITTYELSILEESANKFIHEHPAIDVSAYLAIYSELNRCITHSVITLYEKMQSFPFKKNSEIDKVEDAARTHFSNFRGLYPDYYTTQYNNKGHLIEAEIYLGKAVLKDILDTKRKNTRAIYLSVLLCGGLGIIGTVLGVLFSN